MQEIHVLSLCSFYLFLHFNFSTASIGLDLKELEELLNFKFDWTAALQRTLGPDYSLEEVCCLVFCYSYVHQLRPTNYYSLLHEDNSYAKLVLGLVVRN